MLRTEVIGNTIVFRYNNESASSIQVAGDFNGWQAEYMNNVGHGWWELQTHELDSGIYSYKFVVDGHWVNDQHNYRTSGNQNSIIGVGLSCGHLYYHSFYSESLCKEKKYTIYLPPSYYTEPAKEYPTLYLLCGLMDYELTWTDKGKIEEIADHLTEKGLMDEMIIVMPDKDDSALNHWGAKSFAEYLSQDLVNHIENNYRASSNPAFRAVEGLSLGATWALRLGAFYPYQYTSVGVQSGSPSPEIYKAITGNFGLIQQNKVRFFLGCGTEERELMNGNVQFRNILSMNGIYCEFNTYPGTHDWPLWSYIVYNSLQFHSYSFTRWTF